MQRRLFKLLMTINFSLAIIGVGIFVYGAVKIHS